ncbi:MAG: hypothetical protein WA736_16355 [Candidatus Acidiferrum sp.]
MSLTRLKHKADRLRPTVRDVFTGDIGTQRSEQCGEARDTSQNED